MEKSDEGKRLDRENLNRMSINAEQDEEEEGLWGHARVGHSTGRRHI